MSSISRCMRRRSSYLIDDDRRAGRGQPDRRCRAADADELVIRAVVFGAADAAEDLACIRDARFDRGALILSQLERDRTVDGRRVDLARSLLDRDAAILRTRRDVAVHVADRDPAVRRRDLEPRAARHAQNHVYPPGLALVDRWAARADLTVARGDVDRAEGALRLLLRESDRFLAHREARRRLVPAPHEDSTLFAAVNLQHVDALQRNVLLLLRAR